MKVTEKAVSAVVRRIGSFQYLLVFDYPDAGVQMPKGTVESGESILQATIRELQEESGINDISLPIYIGAWDRVLNRDAGHDLLEIHRWHLSLFSAPSDLPNQWTHQPTGSPEEEKLLFKFHWARVDDTLTQYMAPEFLDITSMLMSYLSDGVSIPSI